MRQRIYLYTALVILVMVLVSSALMQATQAANDTEFVFTVAADMRQYTGAGIYDSCRYFRGAVEAMKTTQAGAFTLIAGDMDPITDTLWTLNQVLGTEHPVVPTVGNHELPGSGHEEARGANLAWLRAHAQDAVRTGTGFFNLRPGPAPCAETTFSFDYGTAHIAILNLYCDTGGDSVTSGDISDLLYEWLKADLAATQQPVRFVVGHEPAYPQPDAVTGRVRHLGDSLDQFPAHRDRFWNLLAEHHVDAYLTAHTHNFSAERIGGVWQVDVGHARGLGDAGAPSTFVRIQVTPSEVRYEVYRADASAPCTYTLTDLWYGDDEQRTTTTPTVTHLPDPPSSVPRWYERGTVDYLLGLLTIGLVVGSVITVVVAMQAANDRMQRSTSQNQPENGTEAINHAATTDKD